MDGHGDALAQTAATERENPVHQCAAALACDHDALDVASQAAARRRVAQRHLAVAEDGAKQVVEVMGDAARERTHRLEALRLAELPLHPAKLVLSVMAIGHIEHESHNARRIALLIGEHASLGLQPVDRAIGMNDAVLRGDVARLLRGLDRGADARPVLGVDQPFPRLVAAVVRTGRDAVHRIEIRRPAVFAFAAADAPFEGDRARGFLREVQHVLACAQLLIDALARRDVRHRARPAQECTRRIPGAATRQMDPTHLAARNDAQLDIQPRCVVREMLRHDLFVSRALAGIEREAVEPFGAARDRAVPRQAAYFEQPRRDVDPVVRDAPVPVSVPGGLHRQRVALLGEAQGIDGLRSLDRDAREVGELLDRVPLL